MSGIPVPTEAFFESISGGLGATLMKLYFHSKDVPTLGVLYPSSASQGTVKKALVRTALGLVSVWGTLVLLVELTPSNGGAILFSTFLFLISLLPLRIFSSWLYLRICFPSSARAGGPGAGIRVCLRTSLLSDIPAAFIYLLLR